MIKTYKIVRFFSTPGKKHRVRKTGLSIDEAIKHCSQEDTRKEGIYFDGYVVEKREANL